MHVFDRTCSPASSTALQTDGGLSHMAGFKSVTASKLGTSAAHLPCRGGRPRKLRQHSHKMAAAAELRARGVAVAGGGGGPSAALQSGASDSVPRPSRGGPNASGFFLKSSPVPAGQRGPTPPGAASGSRSTTVSQRESRRLFYDEVPQRMLPPVPWRSPLDHEIGLLFLPALVAGVLEPIQQVGAWPPRKSCIPCFQPCSAALQRGSRCQGSPCFRGPPPALLPQTTESILVGKLGVSQVSAPRSGAGKKAEHLGGC